MILGPFLATMDIKEKCRRAEAEIDNEQYSLLIDSGSREYSYIKSSVVDKHNLLCYETKLEGSFADGRRYSCNFFTSVKLKIKLENKLLRNISIKAFILDSIPSDVVVGREDIFRNNLYVVMREIDGYELRCQLPAENSYDEWLQLLQLYKLNGPEGIY